MKSILNLILVSTLVFGLFGASAEPSENCLDIAFGLFSVELPDGAAAGPNTGNQLSDFRFETDGDMRLIYANYAPKDEYETTAGKKLESLISFIRQRYESLQRDRDRRRDAGQRCPSALAAHARRCDSRPVV